MVEIPNQMDRVVLGLVDGIGCDTTSRSQEDSAGSKLRSSRRHGDGQQQQKPDNVLDGFGNARY